jgi:hypothetical protein
MPRLDAKEAEILVTLKGEPCLDTADPHVRLVGGGRTQMWAEDPYHVHRAVW